MNSADCWIVLASRRRCVVSAIQRYVQDERLLRSEPVQVAVTQGVAILSGSVSNLLAKKSAVLTGSTVRSPTRRGSA
jgi:osmotically-inducible protein OsmY